MNLEIKIKDKILAKTNTGIEAENIDKLKQCNQAFVLMPENGIVMQYDLIIEKI